MGYSSWGHKELDTTERVSTAARGRCHVHSDQYGRRFPAKQPEFLSLEILKQKTCSRWERFWEGFLEANAVEISTPFTNLKFHNS